MMDWPKAIRAAARRQRLTLEELRGKSGLANGTFYNVLAGRPPRVFRTVEKLINAGVRVPRNASLFTGRQRRLIWPMTHYEQYDCKRRG